MGVIDLAKTLKGKTGWASLSTDDKRVIAYAKTLKGLLAKLKKMDNPDGHIIYLPAGEFSSYVG